MGITGIGPVAGRAALPGVGDTGKAADGGFGDALAEAVSGVDRLQKEADGKVLEMAFGKGEEIHNVMIGIQKAELSFQLMLQVRNKVVEAYQEMMRMAV